jgi:carbon storage regulator
MLVLSRKLYEKIVINGDIIITVVRLGNNQVGIGIEAPDSVGIFRQELFDRARTSEKLASLDTAEVRNKDDARRSGRCLSDTTELLEKERIFS